MKIGILTFQNTMNYGAKLQEYSLQQYLNNLGEDAEVIDYVDNVIEKSEKPLKLSEQKSIKSIIKYFLLHKYQIRKYNKFKSFTDKYIKRSKDSYTKENIINTNNIYDKFVVGSDQVWNTEMTEDDYTYYLNFVNDNFKKNSYAASFGYSKVPEKNKKEIQKYLDDFKRINVREEAGKKIVKDLTNKDSNVVIDPTFLIEKEEWKKFAKKSNNEPYILAYMVNSRPEVFEYIDDLAKKENLKIIYLSDFLKKHNKSKVQVIHDASPEEFINYIYNAKYVVTGSFHAICMSIILEKDFFYMLNDNSVNSRLTNIIDTAGLEDRLITDGNYKEKQKIDYEKVKDRMKDLINNSKEVLNNMIKE